MIYNRGRFHFMWVWSARDWALEFHCIHCCWFWLAWGPLELGITKKRK